MVEVDEGEGNFALIFLLKEQVQQARAGSGLEDALLHNGGLGLRQVVLVDVDQEVGLDQYLVVDAVDIGIGVVMGNQVASALNIGRGQAERQQHAPGWGRAFLLLQLAVAAPILGLGRVNAHIVKHSGTLEHLPRVLVDMLGSGNELGKTVHLEQVLDALGVALVKVDDFPCQLVDNFIVVHNLTNFN